MTTRDADDRCPGVLRPFSAADGAIVRLRVPGGRVPTRDLVRVCELAARYGQPFVQVTSRANLQLRGLDEPLPSPFVHAIGNLGMLPSATHERVRNIVATPGASVDPLVTELDSAITTSPSLAQLSGRWIFALVGHGEQMPPVRPDVAFVVTTRTWNAVWGEIRAGGRTLACPAREAVATLVAVAEDFVATTHTDDGSFWNVADLPPEHPFFARLDARVRLAEHHRVVAGRSEVTPGQVTRHASTLDVGESPVPGMLEVHLPLGLLDAPAARALREVTQDVVVTPKRSVVVREVRSDFDVPRAAAFLERAGFVTESGSAQARFSACIGAPYCRRTDVATLDLTRAAAEAYDAEHAAPHLRGSGRDGAPRVHVVGCDRACGRPAGGHRLVIRPHDLTDILHPTDDDPNGRP